MSLPDRGHLRSNGKNEMDLIGQQRLHGGGRPAHKDELQVQPFAFEKTSFRRHHQRQNLYARRGERAAHWLSGHPVTSGENTEQRNENEFDHTVFFHPYSLPLP